MSPNYSLFTYNQELINIYDGQYYDNIVTLAKYLQKEKNNICDNGVSKVYK